MTEDIGVCGWAQPLSSSSGLYLQFQQRPCARVRLVYSAAHGLSAVWSDRKHGVDFLVFLRRLEMATRQVAGAATIHLEDLEMDRWVCHYQC